MTLLGGLLSDFSTFQYLWIDFFILFPLSVFMSYTKAHDDLSRNNASAKLTSFPVLTSLIGQILIQIFFQVNLKFPLIIFAIILFL